MESTFPGVLAFAFLATMILVGTVLRANLSFVANSLVPSSLIGGIIGFVLIASGLNFGFESADFTAFTFHFFTLSFMSLCLTGKEASAGSDNTSSIVPGGTWLSVLWVMSLVMQALIGIGVVLAYNGLTDGSLSFYLGAMATHGFTQGPGQALAFGSIWESEFGISNAINFGITYAAIGFAVAFVVGVPVARYAISKGMNVNKSAKIDTEFLRGIRARDSEVSAGRQITHSGNVDTFVFHIGILGVAYLLTDQYLVLIHPYAIGWSIAGVNLGVIFSHNLFFLHGLIVCVIIRALMDKFGLGHLIDNETQRRITGSSVDLMVAATIMSIQIAFLAEFIVPITLVCISLLIATALLCFGFGRQLKHLGIERSLTSFGCCCGSTGTGLLLLRIVDPDLRTPIPKELAFFNIAIIFIGFHVLSLMAPILPNYDLGTITAVYLGTFAVGVFVMVVLSKRMARVGTPSSVG